MHKRLFVFLTAVLVLLSFAGCNFEIDDSDFREDTQKMLDAVIAGDMTVCRDLISRDVDDAALEAGIAQMRTVLEGVTDYSLQATNYSRNVSDGVTKTTVRYRMTAGEKIFVVDAVRVSNGEGLAGFHVVRYEEAVYSGTVDHMAGSDAIQWGVLALAAAETVFVIWMLVDCFRRPMINRALWSALILIGNAIVTLTMGNGQFNLNYTVGILWNHTALIRYSTGVNMIRIFLPVGAVIYAFLRKKLAQQENSAQ